MCRDNKYFFRTTKCVAGVCYRGLCRNENSSITDASPPSSMCLELFKVKRMKRSSYVKKFHDITFRNSIDEFLLHLRYYINHNPGHLPSEMHSKMQDSVQRLNRFAYKVKFELLPETETDPAPSGFVASQIRCIYQDHRVEFAIWNNGEYIFLRTDAYKKLKNPDEYLAFLLNAVRLEILAEDEARLRALAEDRDKARAKAIARGDPENIDDAFFVDEDQYANGSFIVKPKGRYRFSCLETVFFLNLPLNLARRSG